MRKAGTQEGEKEKAELSGRRYLKVVVERMKQILNGRMALADLLWRCTTVSEEWLAEKLAMKSAANVSQPLRRLDRKKVSERIPVALRDFLVQK